MLKTCIIWYGSLHYAPVQRGHIFGGLLQLSPLSNDLSPYSARHATNGTVGKRGGLFLDSASTLFFKGGKSGSGEQPEDNSSFAAASLSSDRMGSLPLFYLTEGAGRLLSRAFSPRSSSKQARNRSFSYFRWPTQLCNSIICLACSSCFVSIS